MEMRIVIQRDMFPLLYNKLSTMDPSRPRNRAMVVQMLAENFLACQGQLQLTQPLSQIPAQTAPTRPEPALSSPIYTHTSEMEAQQKVGPGTGGNGGEGQRSPLQGMRLGFFGEE